MHTLIRSYPIGNQYTNRYNYYIVEHLPSGYKIIQRVVSYNVYGMEIGNIIKDLQYAFLVDSGSLDEMVERLAMEAL